MHFLIVSNFYKIAKQKGIFGILIEMIAYFNLEKNKM